MKAVIQSGGKGTRLQPYTMVLPKPLMPVGSKPVIERLLKWLRRHGTLDAYITTGYLGHLIQSYCGSGAQWDLRITYTEEKEPLGTIGALSLIRGKLDSTFLVLNGDVLTDLNLEAFIAAHRQGGSALTVATVRRSVRVDFGILDVSDGYVVQFKEKPRLNYLVSAGIYCMEPSILNHIPFSVPFGFDDLMKYMLEHDIPVRSFLHDGLWLDIGSIDDFKKAQQIAWDDDLPSFHVDSVDLHPIAVN
ncbi:MAG: NTP transferase domain-containing protein [Acetobacteraceae bacterium]|nr:NTP transferase domain-containing protein [Acetobacteraceae bacterium]